MKWFRRSSSAKWWHPDADPFKHPDWWWVDLYWLDLAQKVEKWKEEVGAEASEGILRLSVPQAGEFLDHPAVECAMYSRIRFVLGGRWSDWGLRERVAGDVWAELAFALTRSVPYEHRNERALRGWVYARVYYAALWALRPECWKVQPVTSEVLDSFFSDLPDVIEILDGKEMVEAVVAATLRLTSRQRVVVLGRLADETYESIAERLRISTTAVWNEFGRATGALRALLSSRFGQPA